MARPRLPRSVTELVHWYERYISPLSLIAGFLADNFILLRRVDLWQTDALLFTYLFVAAAGIMLINAVEAGRLRWGWLVAVAPIIPVIVQFSFGGLFSGYLSLYSRSAGFAASWVFVLAVAALLIANERFTRLYVRFAFQMSIYFFVLFSFLIFFLPVVFHAIGPWMFVGSGLTSLVILAIFMRLMRFIIPDIVKRERTRVARSVAVIFLIFNALYFLNLIPPLPLALKEAGVYHDVAKLSSGYYFSAETEPWYASLFSFNTIFHTSAGSTAYVYTSVFAPSGLTTVIYHEWQLYDDASHTWVTREALSFPIIGGRDGGYRGYTLRENIETGRWRVNVKTQYGQLIGQVTFTVDASPGIVPLQEIVN
jgi:hypothetical protein